MKKYTLAVFFLLPWLALAVWVVSLSCIRANGTEVTVAIMGYDPRDLLSGRYIAYQIDWKKTNCAQFPHRQCPSEKEFCTDARWGRQCRFYVPETSANDLDKLFRRRSDQLRFEVVYSYTPRKTPIAKKLLINGTPWQTYLMENPQ